MDEQELNLLGGYGDWAARLPASRQAVFAR
jgi:hypothetical protein